MTPLCSGQEIERKNDRPKHRMQRLNQYHRTTVPGITSPKPQQKRRSQNSDARFDNMIFGAPNGGFFSPNRTGSRHLPTAIARSNSAEMHPQQSFTYLNRLEHGRSAALALGFKQGKTHGLDKEDSFFSFPKKNERKSWRPAEKCRNQRF